VVISIAGILFATPPDRAKNSSALPIMSRRVRGEPSDEELRAYSLSVIQREPGRPET